MGDTRQPRFRLISRLRHYSLVALWRVLRLGFRLSVNHSTCSGRKMVMLLVLLLLDRCVCHRNIPAAC